MQTGQPCLADLMKFVLGFLAERPCTGITGHSLNGGKVLVEILKNLCQGLGVKNKTIGIPDENGTDSRTIDPLGRLNVPENFLQRTSLKGCIFVHGTEGALVPWAAAGDAQQEAPRLTRGAVGRIIIF